MTYALITGASKGIGKSIAIELAKRKIDVLLTARSEKELLEVCDHIRQTYGVQANTVALDLSVADAGQRLYDWCHQNNYEVNCLINNAGFGLSGFFDDHLLEENLSLIQLNIIAITQLSYLFLPMLKKQSKAYILNIASTAAYQAVPMLSLYSATKAFVLSFSRGLRKELTGTGVSVTCISPGPTDTNWAHRAKVSSKALKMAEKLNMQPEDVAKIGVDAMLKGKAEVVTGVVNKLGVFMAWLLPKNLVEASAHSLYK